MASEFKEIEPFTVTGINGGEVTVGRVKKGVNHSFIRLEPMALSDPTRARALRDWLDRALDEGTVRVPREPTAAMLAAGALKAVEQPSVADVKLAREAAREVLKGDVMDGMNRAASADEIIGILATMPQYYRAMIAAASKGALPEGDDGRFRLIETWQKP